MKFYARTLFSNVSLNNVNRFSKVIVNASQKFLFTSIEEFSKNM